MYFTFFCILYFCIFHFSLRNIKTYTNYTNAENACPVRVFAIKYLHQTYTRNYTNYTLKLHQWKKKSQLCEFGFCSREKKGVGSV